MEIESNRVANELELLILKAQFSHKKIEDIRTLLNTVESPDRELYIWGEAGAAESALAHILKCRTGKIEKWINQGVYCTDVSNYTEYVKNFPSTSLLVVSTANVQNVQKECYTMPPHMSILRAGNDPPSTDLFCMTNICFGNRRSNDLYAQEQPNFRRGLTCGTLRWC